VGPALRQRVLNDPIIGIPIHNFWCPFLEILVGITQTNSQLPIVLGDDLGRCRRVPNHLRMHDQLQVSPFPSGRRVG
jgi:hypothetical protein